MKILLLLEVAGQEGTLEIASWEVTTLKQLLSILTEVSEVAKEALRIEP